MSHLAWTIVVYKTFAMMITAGILETSHQNLAVRERFPIYRELYKNRVETPEDSKSGFACFGKSFTNDVLWKVVLFAKPTVRYLFSLFARRSEEIPLIYTLGKHYLLDLI